MSEPLEPLEPADDVVHVVMQPRCLYCGAEHYAPMVTVISLGEAGCEACGRIPPVFHDEAVYRAARRDALAFREASYTDPARDELRRLARDSQDQAEGEEQG